MMYGNKLKDIREEREIKQKELASILNISRSMLGRYETEYAIIPINHLISLCSYLNISLDYIFNFTPKENYSSHKKTADLTAAGKRLKEIRQELKITQSDLATILNTNRSVIANYERGRTFIATPFLYTICLKYHISADYLLALTDKPKYLK